MYFLYSFLSLLLLVQAAPQKPETVGIRLGFEPPTLDWNLGDVPIHVINNVVEGLYRVDADGGIEPVEAESLPKAVRGKGVWRIHLRDGLRWSDGRPVRAQDYVASWK